MHSMKKAWSIFTLSVLVIGSMVISLGFFLSSSHVARAAGSITISTIAHAPDGKPYFDVLPAGKTNLQTDGLPFLFHGVQFRQELWRKAVDNPPYGDEPLSFIDSLFAKAEQLNFKMVEVPLPWTDVECFNCVQGSRDYTVLDSLLTSARNHHLKIDLLWFGPDFVGGPTYDMFVPKYITRNPAKYPQTGPAGVDYLYEDPSSPPGTLSQYRLQLDNPALLSAETSVLADAMQHIYDWDQSPTLGNNYHPVVSVQIEDEPALSPPALTELNTVGETVKNSPYKVITRVNLGGPRVHPSQIDQVSSLPGIDIVGVDPYQTSTSQIADQITRSRVEGTTAGTNLPHIAENSGGNSNTASLALSAFDAGGGYLIYDLIPVTNLKQNPLDQGLLVQGDPHLIEKSYTPGVQGFEAAIDGIGPDIAASPKVNFAAFNDETDTPQSNYTVTKTIGGIPITYTTSAGSLAGAVVDVARGTIKVFSHGPGSFTVRNVTNPANAQATVGGDDENAVWQPTGGSRAVTCTSQPDVACTFSANSDEDIQFTAQFLPFANPTLGQWSYNNGAYSEVGTNGGLAVWHTGTYGDVVAQATIKITNDGGDPSNWAGINIRKSYATSSPFADGYLAYIRADGQICLFKPNVNTQCASTGLSPMTTAIQLTISAQGSLLNVYANGRVYLYTNDTTYDSGYVGLATAKAASTFTQVSFVPGLTAGPGNWSYANGGYTEAGATPQAAAALGQSSSANQTIQVAIKINNDNGNTANWAGINLRKGSISTGSASDGYLIYLRADKQLCLFKPSANFGCVTIFYDPTAEAVLLTVTTNGSTINVYVNNSLAPSMSTSDSTYTSGYWGLAANGANATFTSIVGP